MDEEQQPPKRSKKAYLVHLEDKASKVWDGWPESTRDQKLEEWKAKARAIPGKVRVEVYGRYTKLAETEL